MSNTFFRFKQFTIHQDRCAMKVCTDSCIFGASIHIEAHHQKILDIGSGTGLLSLMLAQRFPHIHIDAVELDNEAFEQSQTNVNESPYTDRITVHHHSIQDFCKIPHAGYDVIVCNPPFFSNHLKSHKAQHNLAIHNEQLPFASLASACAQLLRPHGEIWILLPPYEQSKLQEELALFGFYKNNQWLITNQPNSNTIRNISKYSLQNIASEDENNIVIKDTEGNYSETFKKLLQDFYLIF